MNLQRELAPPRHLENAIVTELRRSRLLRPRRTPWVVAVAVIGIAASALVLWPTPEPQAKYVLFLYSFPASGEGARAEYAAWARQMRPLVMGGEELHDHTVLALNGTPASQQQPAGYFLIDAPDDATAARVARACPHVKHGGGVVLRKIAL